MAHPVISIIGTIYNQAKQAERALDIWCRQNFQYPYEIIVLDDGSTDGTREMVAAFQARYPELIRYFYFDAPHFTRNCTLLFNTAIRRLMRSEIAVLQWYDRIPGSFDALQHLYEPHLEHDRLLVTFLTRHIAGSSSREVFAEEEVDRLLDSVPWRENPEALTRIMGTPGNHCHPHTMNESACFSVRQKHLEIGRAHV
jgi:glycosyltransferase involved in cell wall biosynthesis